MAAKRLAIPDLKLATRQFLGMINDVVFWPHTLVVDLPDTDTDTDAEATRVIRGAARTPCAASRAGRDR